MTQKKKKKQPLSTKGKVTKAPAGDGRKSFSMDTLKEKIFGRK